MKATYKPISFLNFETPSKEVVVTTDDNKNTFEHKNTFENTFEHKNTFEPAVFGPHFWFTLHNGACKYPVEANDFYISRMKGFILGIPIMLPCEKCKVHAYEFIESNAHMLNSICKSRRSLKNFFIDFHNFVNKNTGKPEMTYEEVDKIYKDP